MVPLHDCKVAYTYLCFYIHSNFECSPSLPAGRDDGASGVRTNVWIDVFGV